MDARRARRARRAAWWRATPTTHMHLVVGLALALAPLLAYLARL